MNECRFEAGLHSTSFLLWEGVGCLRSVFCGLVYNINMLFVRAWCLLSAAFVVISKRRTTAFTASHWYASSIDTTRKPQVRSQRALRRFCHCFLTKRKKLFSRVTQRRWRLCEPQNDNRSHHPSDLRRSTVNLHGMYMCCMQDIRLHACLKAMVRIHHVGFLACF